MERTDLLDIAETERRSRPQRQIRCCTAAGCLSAGSAAVLDRLRGAVQDAGLNERVGVAAVGCMRLCCQGPLVQVDPDGELYQQVTSDHAASIVAGINGGTPTPRPPYPAERGLWGMPTLINNVETFANVPTILRRSHFPSRARSAAE